LSLSHHQQQPTGPTMCYIDLSNLNKLIKSATTSDADMTAIMQPYLLTGSFSSFTSSTQEATITNSTDDISSSTINNNNNNSNITNRSNNSNHGSGDEKKEKCLNVLVTS
jgi:hypothetical protein